MRVSRFLTFFGSVPKRARVSNAPLATLAARFGLAVKYGSFSHSSSLIFDLREEETITLPDGKIEHKQVVKHVVKHVPAGAKKGSGSGSGGGHGTGHGTGTGSGIGPGSGSGSGGGHGAGAWDAGKGQVREVHDARHGGGDLCGGADGGVEAGGVHGDGGPYAVQVLVGQAGRGGRGGGGSGGSLGAGDGGDAGGLGRGRLHGLAGDREAAGEDDQGDEEHECW